MPPLLLDDAEVVAVTVGLRSAASGSISGAEETAARALTKIEGLLPARLRRRVRALDAATSSFAFDAPPIDPDLLVALAAACRDATGLRFPYAARDGARSRRRVEPRALVHSGARWYLVAFDLDRDDWRTFRVDRIVGRPTPGAAFASRRELPGRDPAAVVESSLHDWGERPAPPGRVRVHAPAEEVAPQVPRRQATVTPDGDGACVVTSVGGWTRRFLVWLTLLDHKVTVLEPPELAVEARSLAARLADAAIETERS